MLEKFSLQLLVAMMASLQQVPSAFGAFTTDHAISNLQQWSNCSHLKSISVYSSMIGTAHVEHKHNPHTRHRLPQLQRPDTYRFYDEILGGMDICLLWQNNHDSDGNGLRFVCACTNRIFALTFSISTVISTKRTLRVTSGADFELFNVFFNIFFIGLCILCFCIFEMVYVMF